jgi:citrate lyase subunit beta / citryl-CoA lyase
MRPIRSFLFVPGHKEKWVEKIPTFGADAVIIDLEDSVPHDLKPTAREIAAEALPALAAAGQRIWVRVNPTPYIYDMDDLHAVIQPALEGILMSKSGGPQSIKTIDSIVSEIEYRKGMTVGHTQFIPILETAQSIELAYPIALEPRVATLAAASAKNGDVARAVGFQWTKVGLESLHMKSKAVLAVRAAGKDYPIGGLWQDVHDLDGLRESCMFNRQLGFTGEFVLHPSNVAVVNDVYTPDAAEIAYYQGMVETFAAAEKEGRAAVIYEGEHIDYAHVKTAHQILAMVENLK